MVNFIERSKSKGFGKQEKNSIKLRGLIRRSTVSREHIQKEKLKKTEEKKLPKLKDIKVKMNSSQEFPNTIKR